MTVGYYGPFHSAGTRMGCEAKHCQFDLQRVLSIYQTRPYVSVVVVCHVAIMGWDFCRFCSFSRVQFILPGQCSGFSPKPRRLIAVGCVESITSVTLSYDMQDDKYCDKVQGEWRQGGRIKY